MVGIIVFRVYYGGWVVCDIRCVGYVGRGWGRDRRDTAQSDDVRYIAIECVRQKTRDRNMEGSRKQASKQTKETRDRAASVGGAGLIWIATTFPH